MKCPCCELEMKKGVVQSARTIFFTTMSHDFMFTPAGKDVTLSSHNWTRPTCVAYHCEKCKKVVIDYAVEVD